MKRKTQGFTVIVFVVCAAVIVLLALHPEFFSGKKKREYHPTRVIIPHETRTGEHDYSEAELIAREESVSLKVILDEGEVIVSVLNFDFDGDSMEEQIVAYRNLLETESPVYIACIEYDGKSKNYRRIWNAPTAASRPGTISLYTQDLIGDRNSCVLVGGMNGQGEHTMTVFRRNPRAGAEAPFPPFTKIAELRIDGSITVQEITRTLAYQQGITNGQPFTIAAYGHDRNSENILDQIETVYGFNAGSNRYEQRRISRIPGSQIEQRRLRELLSGEKGVFERFINDLWYHVGPQGTLDKNQYIYFDPENREIIFFGDETQQIFNWLNSNATRYGLYVSSQNISVSTLRRFMDIELESLDSIRLRVHEDVRLKIAVNASWDGSYRRAGAVPKKEDDAGRAIKPYIAAIYDSSLGRLRFSANGSYELSSGGTVKKGRYVFFQVNEHELLELRPGQDLADVKNAQNNGQGRLVYRIDSVRRAGSETVAVENLSISRVRLGAMGITDLHEGQIILTYAQ